MRPSPSGTPLARLLAARIRECGPITFAEYMRECLYHPERGYYSRAAPRFADYYTSVDVHPIFGRLLVRQLAEMWDRLGSPRLFWAVEAGAAAGRLAKHILDFAARELPVFYSALRYVAVESSCARRDVLIQALALHARAGRFCAAETLPGEIPAGCIFSNELLDSLPVHRVVWERGALREIYVAAGGEEFRDQLGPPSTPLLADYFQVQGIALREGQQAEVGLDACRWIETAGRALGRGFVLTVDYGHEAGELYDERHMRGTLLAYQRHRADEDFFRAPGEQDLTAHVNFTALDLWGRRVGLARTALVPQWRFLLVLGRANEFADLYDPDQSEAERLRARLLLKNLIHPEAMGEAFQVFIQHKGVESPRLTALAPL